MSFQVIDKLKTTASQMAQNSFLYDWSLSGKSPDRLIIKPVDLWTGDAKRGQSLLDAAGIAERTGPLWDASWWDPETADDLWTTHMHGFSWLRDLRALGGPLAKEQGRLMIENWIERYEHWNAKTWRSDITGRRIAMWIRHADFFCDENQLEFEEAFLTSIAKQATHLSNRITAKQGMQQLQATKGLMFAGIACENQKEWLEKAHTALSKYIEQNIDEDGGHKSRSPAIMLEVLEILIDIRTALKAGARHEPDTLNNTIENMSSVLRLFLHHDRKFALFHNTQEHESDEINAVLSAAGTRKNTKQSLEKTGFERLEIGRSLLIIDTGQAQDPFYDKQAHAAPLSFEFSYGKERIFSNCGTHPISAEWQDALRFTAAHNTACLDQRNACEIKKDGTFGRKVTQTTLHREETKDAALIVASHNGYAPLNGITHTRKLYLGDEGHDLRGEERFTSAFMLIKPIEIAVRFHLHPDVTISSIKEGEEMLLRIPGGIGWRFVRSDGVLELEDSLYLGTGIEPRKTKQIVIYGQMHGDHAAVKWALKREE